MKDHEKLGRFLLEEAIRQYEESYYDSFSATEDEISYSEDYKRSIKKLCNRSKNPFLRGCHSAMRRVAVAVATFLLVFSGMMSVSAVREPMVGFFVEIHENLVKLYFANEDVEKAPDEIQEMYLITELPENSKWLTQFINDKDITTTWANEYVNVTLIQTTLDAGFLANPDSLDIEYKRMAEHDVAIFRTIGVTIYIWNTEEYAYHLVIKGHMRDEECEKMMKSLTRWNWDAEKKGSFINEN